MRYLRSAAALALVAQLAWPTWATAGQSSIVDAAALDAALASHVSEDQAARQRVATLLSRPEVRQIAEANGFDLVRAQGAVATLQGEDLRTLDAMAASYDAQLAGSEIRQRHVILALAFIGAVVVVMAILD
jgi:hypothetical protein